ncbi:MAG: tRNA (guanosine(37)-N1)-methyltransferase TrmD, partial [Candidatus Hydrogenedentes bacterium]|nr:tRNA (guanosine(37)-N1)-methyltransferase TrmD [Candidatus Hydrogenedentota bacterium]
PIIVYGDEMDELKRVEKGDRFMRMVMKCEPVFAAVESLKEVNTLGRIVLLSPRGRRLTQPILKEWAQAADLVLICGRYEGFDERISESLCTDEVSIGDYVLSGGEFPAMVIIDALSRMLPGVIGDFESVETDSFYDDILGAPQYTRPAKFRGLEVPEVLRNGNHKEIGRYRRKEAIRLTRLRRPELLEKCTEEDAPLLEEIEREERVAHEER